MTPFILPGFEVIPSINDGRIELALSGNADMSVRGTLVQYLKDFDVHVQSQGVRFVNVKLADLYFLSSSCLQAIAAWVQTIASRPPEARYTVKFETHAGQPWQKRSLEAIRLVAPSVTVVL